MFRAKLLNVLKKTLTEVKSKLAENLYKNYDGAVYVGTHAMIMDQLISTIHRMILSRHYEKNTKKIIGLSILAVGGYGRGELAPHSDIDLLFLYQKDQLTKHQPVIEYILYLLWDLGLKVGHATRTSDQCLEAANDDITIKYV